MKQIIKVLPFLGLALLAWLISSEFHQATANARGAQLLITKQTCDEARLHNTKASERACGVSQQQTNSEYLCRVSGADTTCWVEAK